MDVIEDLHMQNQSLTEEVSALRAELAKWGANGQGRILTLQAACEVVLTRTRTRTRTRTERNPSPNTNPHPHPYPNPSLPYVYRSTCA